MAATTILNKNQRLTNKMLENEKLQENMNLTIFMTFIIPAIISIAKKKDKIKLLSIKILLFEFKCKGGNNIWRRKNVIRQFVSDLIKDANLAHIKSK